ncbi:MAG: EAL domain-containing protein [Rhodocyclaceae bacterium]|nr:EAL domain-containing protein [Rhodocyclaceae bacterium]
MNNDPHATVRRTRQIALSVAGSLTAHPVLAAAPVLAASSAPLALLATLGVITGGLWWLCHRNARKARDDLAAADARMAAFEAAHVITWRKTRGARALGEVSPVVERILGYPADSWHAPDAWHRVVHPDDRNAALARYRSALHSDAPIEVRYRLRHQDGRMVAVRDRVICVHSDSGVDTLHGFLVVDRTPPPALAVQDADNHLLGVFEHAAVGIAICDPDGVFRRVNTRFCQITGRSAGDLVGCRFDALSPADTRAAEAAQLDILHAGQRDTLQCDKRFVCPDGRMAWATVSISARRDAAGRIDSLIAIVQDVTRQHAATAALADEERRLRTVLDTLGEGVVMRDRRGKVILSNSAAARIFALSEAEMARFTLDQPPVRFLRENGDPFPTEELPSMRTLADGEGHSAVQGVVRDDGSVRWLWTHSKPIPGPDGAPAAVVTSIADITRLREAETRLRLADKAVDHSADAIMVTTSEGQILRVNPAFTRITGYTVEEVVGRTPALLRSGRHDASFYAAMWESIRRAGAWQGDIWNRRKDGHIFAERLSISAVHNAAGQISHYVAVFSDVTEARIQEARFAHMAQHDALTGLANRSLMEDRLAQALRRADRSNHPLALLFLDLDHFKTVNDTFGHAVGDALLKAVAVRLLACVRASDSVGRQAGDEFLILLPELDDARQAGQVAGKIIAELARPFAIGEHPVSTSFSIGIALFPNDASDADTLRQHADTALYHAKASGRNTFRFFTDTMNADTERRQQCEMALRDALAADTVQMAYQPLRQLADGRIVAMEAQCHWRDPRLGEMTPARFAELADDSALVLALDRWALRTACREAARWLAHGAHGVRVAVNLSLAALRHDDAAAMVRAGLAEAGLPADHLELELGEAVLRDAHSRLGDTLAQLKALGVRLVIDHFGADQNTLTRLGQLGIDRLKIDRSFLADPGEASADNGIVRTFVELGRNLGIEVVADGVDTDTQQSHVLAAGCRVGQGVLLGPPMDPERTLQRLTETPGAPA